MTAAAAELAASVTEETEAGTESVVAVAVAATAESAVETGAKNHLDRWQWKLEPSLRAA